MGSVIGTTSHEVRLARFLGVEDTPLPSGWFGLLAPGQRLRFAERRQALHIPTLMRPSIPGDFFQCIRRAGAGQCGVQQIVVVLATESDPRRTAGPLAEGRLFHFLNPFERGLVPRQLQYEEILRGCVWLPFLSQPMMALLHQIAVQDFWKRLGRQAMFHGVAARDALSFWSLRAPLAASVSGIRKL